MGNLNLPVVLYGAGSRAAFEKKQAELYGLNPACFVDADVRKQGGVCCGLPVLSLKQVKGKYGEFYVYLTPGWEKHREIFDCLIEQGIKQERILNYSEMEKCLGCEELDSSLYAYSSSLISCCRSNDSMKESEVFWKNNDWDMEGAVLEYISMKDRLIRSIKNEEVCRCTGCSNIKNEMRPVRKTAKLLALSIEQLCQLSCVYCVYKNEESIFYAKANDRHFVRDFDYKRFIEILDRRELLSYDAVILLTGGEITISPRVDEILDAVQEYRLQVLTNAVIYNERIAELTARPGSCVNISVDAGTRQTYKLVKGVDAFDKVWTNIKKYKGCGVTVFVKYVFLEENSNEADVMGFIHEAVKAGVNGNDTIMISADYYRKVYCTQEQMRLMAKMLSIAEQNEISWYIVQTFKPDEKAEILRLKSEMN